MAQYVDLQRGSMEERLLSCHVPWLNIFNKLRYVAWFLIFQPERKPPGTSNTNNSNCAIPKIWNGRALDRVTKQEHWPNGQKLSKKCPKIVFSDPLDNFWTFFGQFFDIFRTFCRHSLSLGCPTICPLQPRIEFRLIWCLVLRQLKWNRILWFVDLSAGGSNHAMTVQVALESGQNATRVAAVCLKKFAHRYGSDCEPQLEPIWVVQWSRTFSNAMHLHFVPLPAYQVVYSLQWGIEAWDHAAVCMLAPVSLLRLGVRVARFMCKVAGWTSKLTRVTVGPSQEIQFVWCKSGGSYAMILGNDSYAIRPLFLRHMIVAHTFLEVWGGRWLPVFSSLFHYLIALTCTASGGRNGRQIAFSADVTFRHPWSPVLAGKEIFMHEGLRRCSASPIQDAYRAWISPTTPFCAPFCEEETIRGN